MGLESLRILFSLLRLGNGWNIGIGFGWNNWGWNNWGWNPYWDPYFGYGGYGYYNPWYGYYSPYYGGYYGYNPYYYGGYYYPRNNYKEVELMPLLEEMVSKILITEVLTIE